MMAMKKRNNNSNEENVKIMHPSEEEAGVNPKPKKIREGVSRSIKGKNKPSNRPKKPKKPTPPPPSKRDK